MIYKKIDCKSYFYFILIKNIMTHDNADFREDYIEHENHIDFEDELDYPVILY